METKPTYKSIYELLRKDILSGVYAEGVLMPTESVLSEKFGVSRPTVAKAYNKLQEEGLITKKKGMGTIINPSRKQKDKPRFGLLLPGAGESEIFSIINDCLLRFSEEDRFDCLWEGATASNADTRRELIESCCNNYIKQGVDGIFFSPLERVNDAHIINNEICKKIEEAGIPIVLIDRDVCDIPSRSKHDLVSLDNFSAGCTMARHLVECGCTDIHFVYRPDSAVSVRLRLAGIRDTLLRLDIPLSENNIHCVNPEDPETAAAINIKSGKTGIICANDSTAAVLMSTLGDAGHDVSTDFLICGYDDMKYSSHLRYPLTSFRQPCVEMADTSVELMMRRLSAPTSPTLTVTLTGSIVVRESTKFKK